MPNTAYTRPLPSGEHQGRDGGSLRVFEQFMWLEVGSVKAALSRPTHQRVTQTVGLLVIITYFCYLRQAERQQTACPFDQSKTRPKAGESLFVFGYSKVAMLN
jgi:hypothetical protein